jgi:hypothetical protein
VEDEIRPVVEALIRRGYRTVESCEGHGSCAFVGFAVPSDLRGSVVRLMRATGVQVLPYSFTGDIFQDRRMMRSWFGEGLWELLKIYSLDVDTDARKILSLPEPTAHPDLFFQRVSLQTQPVSSDHVVWSGALSDFDLSSPHRYILVGRSDFQAPPQGFVGVARVEWEGRAVFNESYPMVFDLSYHRALGLRLDDCEALFELGLLLRDQAFLPYPT